MDRKKHTEIDATIYFKRFQNYIDSSKVLSTITTILAAVTIIASTVTLVIGILYLNECPAEKAIPILLIIGGSILIIGHIAHLIQKCIELKRTHYSKQEVNTKKIEKFFSIIRFIFMILALMWLLSASIIVFSIKSISHDKSTSNKFNYCNQTCYIFLMKKCIVMWSLIGVIIITTIIILSIGKYKTKQHLYNQPAKITIKETSKTKN